jgi:hypothetical protein
MEDQRKRAGFGTSIASRRKRERVSMPLMFAPQLTMQRVRARVMPT